MSLRRNQLALVHIAKKDMGLDDETYRGHIAAIAPHRTSAKDLTQEQLEALLKRFRAFGWKPKPKPGKPRYSPKTRDKPGPKTPIDKIRALWIECANAGKVGKGEQALGAFVQRMTSKTLKPQVSRVEWTNARQQRAIIEALKAMLERTNAD